MSCREADVANVANFTGSRKQTRSKEIERWCWSSPSDWPFLQAHLRGSLPVLRWAPWVARGPPGPRDPAQAPGESHDNIEICWNDYITWPYMWLAIAGKISTKISTPRIFIRQHSSIEVIKVPLLHCKSLLQLLIGMNPDTQVLEAQQPPFRGQKKHEDPEVVENIYSKSSANIFFQ